MLPIYGCGKSVERSNDHSRKGPDVLFRPFVATKFTPKLLSLAFSQSSPTDLAPSPQALSHNIPATKIKYQENKGSKDMNV